MGEHLPGMTLCWALWARPLEPQVTGRNARPGQDLGWPLRSAGRPAPLGASPRPVCLPTTRPGSRCLKHLAYPGSSPERTKAKTRDAAPSRLPHAWRYVAGRQLPRRHPPPSPRTFRPARNMPNVQIPQVMREFVTRGALVIQEWKPDRGLGLERHSPGPPARARVAASRLLGTGEESRDGP